MLASDTLPSYSALAADQLAVRSAVITDIQPWHGTLSIGQQPMMHYIARSEKVAIALSILFVIILPEIRVVN